MLQTQKGYTIIELLIVIVLIGILLSLALIGIPNTQRDARDTERSSDIDNLHSRLEDYFSDHAGYPATVSLSVFPRLDPGALKDPAGNAIKINSPVSDQQAAINLPDPVKSGPQYSYTAYPTGCGVSTPCAGYVLKSFIELPSSKLPNPYVKRGINNN